MSAEQHVWACAPLPDDVQRALELIRNTEGVCHVAVMPDVHRAEDVCVGTVVGTADVVIPAAVGADIGCGMAAIRFDVDAGCIRDERTAARVLALLNARVPGLHHASRSRPVLPPEVLAAELSHASLRKQAQRDGVLEFGTLGRGNHFLELQADDDGLLWLMVHSGSRAMGPEILRHHLAASRMTTTGLRVINAGAAEPYLQDVRWALAYAHHSRAYMLQVVTDILGSLVGAAADPATLITCEHNHVRQEEHRGRLLWVHRKGAMFAGAGVAGVIPGSMGSSSFHVQGRGCEDALCSSSHGAGRAMSRSQARRAVTLRALEDQLRGVHFDHRLALRLRDEAPAAYKDISAVMRAQRELVRVVRRLRPLLSYKAA
ncbi:MAG: RtcB family protein [Deltaproteobacteria bacterium]|nr:RtcB family protein [Deltaproteobacteria bacterium]